MSPTLKDLETLAKGAGEILRAGFGGHNHISQKGTIDLVTEVDKKSEEYILREIATKFPDHRVVAEESGGMPGNGEQVWYVDPLDGTTNFAHGLPIFSVSIAYAERGDIQHGVVYDPMRGELFSAQKGKGASLNGTSIHVGGQSELAKSLVVTGFPYDRFINPKNNLDHFNQFALKVQGIRRLGSAAMDLCYVGAGRLDGYWELRLEAWDLAAGALIAREAGAEVSKLDGDPEMLVPPFSVVAANPALYKKMLEVLRD